MGCYQLHLYNCWCMWCAHKIISTKKKIDRWIEQQAFKANYDVKSVDFNVNTRSNPQHRKLIDTRNIRLSTDTTWHNLINILVEGELEAVFFRCEESSCKIGCINSYSYMVSSATEGSINFANTTFETTFQQENITNEHAMWKHIENMRKYAETRCRQTNYMKGKGRANNVLAPNSWINAMTDLYDLVDEMTECCHDRLAWNKSNRGTFEEWRIKKMKTWHGRISWITWHGRISWIITQLILTQSNLDILEFPMNKNNISWCIPSMETTTNILDNPI